MLLLLLFFEEGRNKEVETRINDKLNPQKNINVNLKCFHHCAIQPTSLKLPPKIIVF